MKGFLALAGFAMVASVAQAGQIGTFSSNVTGFHLIYTLGIPGTDTIQVTAAGFWTPAGGSPTAATLVFTNEPTSGQLVTQTGVSPNFNDSQSYLAGLGTGAFTIKSGGTNYLSGTFDNLTNGALSGNDHGGSAVFSSSSVGTNNNVTFTSDFGTYLTDEALSFGVSNLAGASGGLTINGQGLFESANGSISGTFSAAIVNTIPEPGTLALLGSALLGLGLIGRKRLGR